MIDNTTYLKIDSKLNKRQTLHGKFTPNARTVEHRCYLYIFHWFQPGRLAIMQADRSIE